MRRIFLLGGDDWDVNTGLDMWWLGLAGSRPTVCLIPTAGGDAAHEINGFTRSFQWACAGIKVLRLFRREVSDIDAFLDDVSLVYVTGGNTASMLAVWRAHGVDAALRRAWDRGVVMGGVSAGAIAFAAGGTTDSFGLLQGMTGALGLVDFTVSPHHNDPGRRPLFEALIRDGRLSSGYGLDNGVGALITESTCSRIVSDQPEARAYFTDPAGSREIVPDVL